MKKNYVDSENNKWDIVFSKLDAGFQIDSVVMDEVIIAEDYCIEENNKNSIWIIEDGKKSLAHFSRIDGIWWVHYRGKITTWSEMSISTNVGQIEEIGSLTAPMPGKILKLCVVEGESVSSGQELVYMEAMKMEHRITSPIDGIVGNIYFEEGQQVEQGNLLIEVDELEE